MRGEDISSRTACFDTFMNLSHCPTIAIGDGVTRINELTQDGLPVTEGELVLRELRQACGIDV